MLNQVMGDESAIPFLEDEAIEFECLLIEPQDRHISVDGFLCFRRNSPEKYVQLEDVHCEFGGALGIKQEEEHLLGQEVRDIMPNENESGKLQAPNALLTCEDYLLDIESGESITKLDYHLGKGSQNLVLESHTEENKAGYNGPPQESQLSCPIDWMHDFPEDLDMNDYESNGIFSCSPNSELSADRWFKYPTSFPVESIEQLEDVSGMFPVKNEKNTTSSPGLKSEEMFCSSITEQQNVYESVGQHAEGEPNIGQDVSRCPPQGSVICPPTGKRLRKPPHRFIDELLEPNSRQVRRKFSIPASKGKSSNVKHHKHYCVKSKAERSFSGEPAAIAIQVPFGPLICEEREKKQVPVVTKVIHPKPIASMAISEGDCISSRKKQTPVAPKVLHSKPIASVAKSEEDFVSSQQMQLCIVPKVLDSEPVASVATSGEDSLSIMKTVEEGGRRKHHILWTVSEVKKLIDGVSQYGVGRWSHIKKDLFSSSAHRTAVDLKDKWRNLLKATCVQTEGKRGEDKKRNLAWRPLPKSVIRRVRELAVLYPYPRDFQTKH